MVNPDRLDHDGRTPLHHAARSENLRSVTLLIEAGGDPSLRDAEGKLPEDLTKAPEIKATLADTRRKREVKALDAEIDAGAGDLCQGQRRRGP